MATDLVKAMFAKLKTGSSRALSRLPAHAASLADDGGCAALFHLPQWYRLGRSALWIELLANVEELRPKRGRKAGVENKKGNDRHRCPPKPPSK
jgi:hypothetical protein